MKKAISLLLSLLTLLSALSIGLTAFAGESETVTKFAVASDLHFNKPSEEMTIYDDTSEIFGYANRRAAMEDESGYIIDEFLTQCKNDPSIEFVLIPGDVCDDGRTIFEDHEIMAEKFRKFEEESGKPIYLINGNHDTSTLDTEFNNDMFYETYYEFGFDEAIDTLEGTLSYTADLNDKYRLIACDSCDPSVSTEDGLTAKRVNWICKMAKKATAEGKYPILMMHHNFIDHMPIQRIISRNFIVRNHSLTAAKLANAGIRLAFTGHEHGSDVASYTSLSGNKIYDFSTTSLTMYPLQYRVMTLTDSEIKYEARQIEKIDTDALTAATKGYTQEQIDYMNSDLAAYSKEFLKQGIKYRLALGFTEEKLGVEESSAFYSLVMTAVKGLTKLLEMPLYGENSVQQLAKEYNILLPESDYENGWDIITELMSYHYAGDEPFTVDSPTVTLILRIAALILLDDLSTVNDEVFFGYINNFLKEKGSGDLFKSVTKLAASTFGPYTAGELFITAIASPIIYGFCLDTDTPDNNGTVEGYGINNNKENAKEAFSAFFQKIITYVKLFFGYLTTGIRG